MLSPADFSRITEACGRLYEAPLYISDSPDLKLLDLRAQARRMKSHQDVKIIFVDYITLISSENRELPRHEQIAEVSRSLKALARELNLPVIALSQVRRETEGKKPNLADLRESGSIEQDADVVIFLHTEDLKAEVREVVRCKAEKRACRRHCAGVPREVHQVRGPRARVRSVGEGHRKNGSERQVRFRHARE